MKAGIGNRVGVFMPSSYGSLESPSLSKMNGNLEANSGRRGGMRGFNIGRYSNVNGSHAY